MKVDVVKQINFIESNFWNLGQETREAQRGVLLVLLPLNATILLSILGLIVPLHLGESVFSRTLIIISCFCFLISLGLCMYTLIQLLLHLALAVPKSIVTLFQCHKLLAEKKSEIDAPDTQIFINPNYFILGGICFILGVLNTAFTLILSFYDNLSIYIVGIANVVILIGVLILIRPFLREDITIQELIAKNVKKNSTI